MHIFLCNAFVRTVKLMHDTLCSKYDQDTTDKVSRTQPRNFKYKNIGCLSNTTTTSV